MKEVLIITGACGVGKSTLAKTWAKSKNGATVDCDYLTEWIYNEDFPHWSLKGEKLVAKLAAKIAKEYVDWGMSTSIDNVWSPAGIEILKNNFQSHSHVKVKVVWLNCERAENHKRDQQRIPDNQMKERVDIVNDELEAYLWPAYVHKLDTTTLCVEDTIEWINKLT